MSVTGLANEVSPFDLSIGTLRYHSKVFDEVLRHRLRELAATHVRYGYRRLTVLLRREGWRVNVKRIYPLYAEEGLIVRTKQRRKMARRQRVATPMAAGVNERWTTQRQTGGWAFVPHSDGSHARACLPRSRQVDDGDGSGPDTGRGEARTRQPAQKHHRGQRQ